MQAVDSASLSYPDKEETTGKAILEDLYKIEIEFRYELISSLAISVSSQA